MSKITGKRLAKREESRNVGQEIVDGIRDIKPGCSVSRSTPERGR